MTHAHTHIQTMRDTHTTKPYTAQGHSHTHTSPDKRAHTQFVELFTKRKTSPPISTHSLSLSHTHTSYWQITCIPVPPGLIGYSCAQRQMHLSTVATCRVRWTPVAANDVGKSTDASPRWAADRCAIGRRDRRRTRRDSAHRTSATECRTRRRSATDRTRCLKVALSTSTDRWRVLPSGALFRPRHDR